MRSRLNAKLLLYGTRRPYCCDDGWFARKIAVSVATHGQRVTLLLPSIDLRAEYDLTSDAGDKYVAPRIYLHI